MIIFDVEANGYLEEATRIWCVVCFDTKTKEWYEFGPEDLTGFRDLVERNASEKFCAHSGFSYDFKLLDKLWPEFADLVPAEQRVDSLVYARLAMPDADGFWIEQEDGTKKSEIHTIRAWGRRLGIEKGTFGYTHGFDEWHPDMLPYCRRDVEVTLAMMRHLRKEYPWVFKEECGALEMAFARCIQGMMDVGVPFDPERSEVVADRVEKRLALLNNEIVRHRPYFVEHYVTPKKKLPRTKYIPFNPNSRQHVVKHLQLKYGWTPTKYTKSGQVALDNKVIEELPYEEAQPLAEYLLLKKVIGYLRTGSEAWTHHYNPTTGRIHGFINHNGAVTGRCTHSRPNTANIPARGVGAECRSLFVAPEGLVLVGCDAGKLEQITLANSLYPFDGGRYIEFVLNGDVHVEVQKAVGLPSRDKAKTWGYANMYGGGYHKLGSIRGFDDEKHFERYVNRNKQLQNSMIRSYKRRFKRKPPADYGPLCVLGKELKDKFLKNMEGFEDFQNFLIEQMREKRTVTGLDGREIPVRAKHSIINAKNQSDGAVIMKWATVEACHRLAGKAELVLHVHDEFQFLTTPELAEEVGQTLAACITEAAEHFGFALPLGADYAVGQTWKETH